MVTDYISTAELAGYLGIDDSAYNSQLAAAVTSASRAIDNGCGRRFYQDTTTSTRVYRAPHRSQSLTVDDIATTTGLAVNIDWGYDATYQTVVPAADYRLAPLNGIVDGIEQHAYTHIIFIPQRLWPEDDGIPRAQITARWGWPAIPAPIKQAALIIGADLFKQKDAPFGVAGFGEFGSIRMRDNLIARVTGLIGPYQRAVGIA